MIDVSNLTKSYGPIEALRGVTFHIAPGEIIGLLGPNGAGKTTVDQFGAWLALKPLEGGLREMLSSYGIEVQRSLVMDPQNEPFPVSVTQNVGGFQVQENLAVNYSLFTVKDLVEKKHDDFILALAAPTPAGNTGAP